MRPLQTCCPEGLPSVALLELRSVAAVWVGGPLPAADDAIVFLATRSIEQA